MEYDERANIFIHRILGIRIISFTGTAVQQLPAEFESAVNGYLDHCASEGLEPERPASG